MPDVRVTEDRQRKRFAASLQALEDAQEGLHAPLPRDESAPETLEDEAARRRGFVREIVRGLRAMMGEFEETRAIADEYAVLTKRGERGPRLERLKEIVAARNALKTEILAALNEGMVVGTRAVAKAIDAEPDLGLRNALRRWRQAELDIAKRDLTAAEATLAEANAAQIRANEDLNTPDRARNMANLDAAEALREVHSLRDRIGFLNGENIPHREGVKADARQSAITQQFLNEIARDMLGYPFGSREFLQWDGTPPPKVEGGAIVTNAPAPPIDFGQVMAVANATPGGASA